MGSSVSSRRWYVSFRGATQTLQENSGTVPYLGHGRFLSHYNLLLFVLFARIEYELLGVSSEKAEIGSCVSHKYFLI